MTDTPMASPLEQVRSMLARVASAPARQRVEKALVLWELGYVREALSQFRVTAERAVRAALALCGDRATAAELEAELDRGRTSAVIERLHHELELIPARVGLQLYTLLAWGNYASHHQKKGHQARASDLAVLVSIALDLHDWLGQEVTGEGGIYEEEPPGRQGAGLPPEDGGGESTPERVTRLLLERAGPRLRVEPHGLSLPDLSLELFWDMPAAPAEGSEPYRGLRCFDPEDAGRFYGRSELIEALEESTDRRRFTVLSGASGAGKTSLLRAGLIPRLLGIGCGVLVLAEYSAEAMALLLGVRELWGRRPLVLVFDQLERALLPEVEAGVQRQVLALAANFGLTSHGRRVVAGIREDYLGRLLREVGAAAEQGGDEPVIVAAGPLGEAQCREAVTRPLQGSGVTLDPGLLEEVLLPALVEGEGGAAPSRLQIVCGRLYEAALARGGAMDLALYRELGGAGRILSSYLDRALTSGRYDEEQELTRALLKAMTGPEVRRWQGLGELWQRLHGDSMVTDEVQLRSLLSRLTDDRLVVARAGAGPGAPVRYSLMHDQLAVIVRAWRSAAELELQEAQERLDRALASFSEDPRRRDLLRGAGLQLVERHFPRLRAEGGRAAALLVASRRARLSRRLGVAALLGIALLGLLFGLHQLRRAMHQRDRAVQLADQGVMLHAQQVLPRDPTLAVAWLRNLRQPTSGIAGLELAERARELGVARVISGHRDVVTSVAFSPDGKSIASASRDGTVRLHSVAPGGTSRLLGRHGAAAQAVAFSPDGKLLASGGRDGVVRLYGLSPPRSLGALGEAGGGVEALLFTPDSGTLIWAGEDPAVTLWSVADGRVSGRLTSALGDGARILSLALEPLGGWLAAGDSAGTLVVWHLEQRLPPEHRKAAHVGAVHGLAWSSDGGTLASAGLDGAVQLWRSGQVTARSRGADKALALAFLPGGKSLAVAGSGREVRFMHGGGGEDPERAPPLRGHLGAVHALAVSPDGKLLATGSRDNTIRLWDLAARERQGDGGHARLQGHRREVWAVAFTPGGERLASVGAGGTVRLWDGKTGEATASPLSHGGEAFALAISPDGKRLVTAGWGGEVSLMEIGKTPRRLATARVQAGAVYAAAFTPDGRGIALGGRDGYVHLLDGRTLKPAPGGAVMAHPEGLHALRFARGGALLLTGCRDGMIRAWDMASRRQRGRPLAGHSGAVYALALGPDGRTLASGAADATIQLWDLDTRAAQGDPLQGHQSWVLSLAFAPDGRALASGSADGTIRFWDPAARRPLGPPLHGHHDWVHTVAFAPDGQTLASGSADATVRLWRLDRSTLPRLLQRIDALTNLRVSLEGRVSYRR